MRRASLLLAIGVMGCGSSTIEPPGTGGGGAGTGPGGAGGATTSATSTMSTTGTETTSSTTSTTTTTSSVSSSSSSTGGVPPTCNGPDTTTAGVQCTYAYNGFNSSASVNKNSTVAWSCDATKRNMTSNGIPDHDTGTFPNPNCPNTIAAKNTTASLTLTPVSTGNASKVQPVGYALNGVKFDPATAGTCTVNGGTTNCSLIGNTGNWNIEALGQSSFNFGVDSNNAHVQPTGDYHYHGIPESMLTKLAGSEMKPILVGFALDGFPVYARYGYTDPADAGSAVKVVKGSYQLKATPDANRPSTTTYPMGAFTQDYQYVAGSGDLDDCNGRTAVTPEFPCGIYHYYLTDTYPFIGRCVKGTPSGGGMMMGGNPPTCMPGQTQMCCGDGHCDGPETAANCPADCP